jgi:hypothetical protein
MLPTRDARLVRWTSEHVQNRIDGMLTQTARFSDLSRDSKAVAAAADRGAVTITRRDGEDLVLERASVVEHRRAGLQLAAQIVAVAVSEWPEGFATRLNVPFPWIRFLPEPYREDFATELVEVARACAAVSVFDDLATTIHAWQSTAEAYAAGLVDVEPAWLDQPAHVERPVA